MRYVLLAYRVANGALATAMCYVFLFPLMFLVIWTSEGWHYARAEMHGAYADAWSRFRGYVRSGR